MRIHIVEDEVKMAQNLKAGLENEGFTVDYSLDGRQGLDFIFFHNETLDLILLDLMLPQIDGVTLCRNVRAEKITTPILMLSAKNTTEDKILGLNCGADDYLTKPFAFEELLARIKALLRRPQVALPSEFKIKDLKLDTISRKVFINEIELVLTLKEFALIEYFIRHPNQVINREQLIDNLWDINFDSFSNVVDVHIKNLRAKLAKFGYDENLETIRGVGYSLKV